MPWLGVQKTRQFRFGKIRGVIKLPAAHHSVAVLQLELGNELFLRNPIVSDSECFVVHNHNRFVAKKSDFNAIPLI